MHGVTLGTNGSSCGFRKEIKYTKTASPTQNTRSPHRIFSRVSLLHVLHCVLAFRICSCTCCTASHIGPGCNVTCRPPCRRGLRLGVRGLCDPPPLELALSEGRPCSPQGQFASRGITDGESSLPFFLMTASAFTAAPPPFPRA